MLSALLISVMMSVAPASPSATGARPQPLPGETWAGHHVVFGKRKIPVRGQVRTRMDTFVLARVVADGDRLRVEEQACAVDIASVAGITVSMDPSHIPPAKITLNRNASEPGWVGSAENGWGSDDVDGDGHPGLTITVDAPICSGKLYVSQQASTVARLHRAGPQISGATHVRVQQNVLGAEGACLSAFARSSREVVSGPRSYISVPKNTTCASLLRSPWPVRATRDLPKGR